LASRSAERADLFLVGHGKILPKLRKIGINRPADAMAPAEIIEILRRRNRDLGHTVLGDGFEKPERLDIDARAPLNAAVNGKLDLDVLHVLGCGFADPLVGTEFGGCGGITHKRETDSSERAEKIVEPGLAPKLPIRNGFKADRLLHLHGLGDEAVFYLRELGVAVIAWPPLGAQAAENLHARFAKRAGAMQAADMFGAKRRI